MFNVNFFLLKVKDHENRSRAPTRAFAIGANIFIKKWLKLLIKSYYLI